MSKSKIAQIRQPKKTQVLSFRVPVEMYHEYEQTCLELQQPMTSIVRQAIFEFLESIKKGHLNN